MRAWNRRQRMLAAALAVSAMAVAWASQLEKEPPVAQPRSTAAVAPVDTRPAGALAVERVVALRRAGGDKPLANAFAPRSFQPPPPPRPKVVAAPPPAPTAPPLPFTYMGMLREGSSVVVFVVRDEQMHSVRAGDVIGGTYRVEAIGPDSVTFVYLPMNEKQTLRIGDPS